MREGIEKIINGFDKAASKKLKKTTGVAVVVVDHGVAEIFSVGTHKDKRNSLQ
ncbi:MAG: hypothetical protein NTX91_04150 [candidate division SR1 bacterium]|nr:hypothetical protein [candidate division SR1 bacterium]